MESDATTCSGSAPPWRPSREALAASIEREIFAEVLPEYRRQRDRRAWAPPRARHHRSPAATLPPLCPHVGRKQRGRFGGHFS